MSDQSTTAAEGHEGGFSFELEQLEGYRFRVTFDLEGADDLITDEPTPLGEGAGPNPSRMLAAAVANCLSASLLFCLQKSRVEGAHVRATVTTSMERNERRRLRIGGFDVRIEVSGVTDEARLERCLGLFEDFCVVTESVRNGVPVNVEVVRG
jgi:uncharacterized OsmC-like protein